MSNGNISGKIANSSSISGNVNIKNSISGSASKGTEMYGSIMATILKGLSAYEVAVVEGGYTGTVEEWLQSLIGNGIESVNMDSDGILTIHFTDGTLYTTPISLKGKSAYHVAQENGFTGSVSDWLSSLEATVELGTVTTGGNLSITNSGTNKNAVFDFVLPSNTIDNLTQDEDVIFYCGTATEVV